MSVQGASNLLGPSAQIADEEPQIIGPQTYRGCVRNFISSLNREEKQENAFRSELRHRRLSRDIHKENVRDLLEIAAQTLQVSGEGAKNINSLLKLFDEIDSNQLQNIIGAVNPHLGEVRDLLSLGSQIMSVQVAARLVKRLDNAFEELEQWRRILESRGDSTDQVNALMERLNLIKEDSHQKLLKEEVKLRSKIVGVGLTTSEFIVDQVISHATHLTDESLEILSLVNDSLDAINNPLSFAVKLHQIYLQKDFVGQLKLIDADKYAAKIKAIEEEILDAQMSAAKSGIRSVLNIGIKTIDILNNPTVAKATTIGANILSTLSKAAVIAGFVDSVVGLGFRIYSFVRCIQKYKVLKNHITKIEKHSNKSVEKVSHVAREVLQAKAHFLKGEKKAGEFDISKKSIRLFSGTLGLVAGITGVLTVAGVTVGAVGATVLAASGIGAAVIGGLIALAGVAMVIYKNRHYFEYVGNTWKQPLKKLINKIKMSHVQRLQRNAFPQNTVQGNQPITPNEAQARVVKELKFRSRVHALEEKRKKIDEISASHEDMLEFRKLQTQMRGWDIQHFEALAASVRNELASEQGRQNLESLLEKYGFVYFEELSFATVLRFILDTNS